MSVKVWSGLLVVSLMAFLPGRAIDFEVRDGVVRAREGGEILWENTHDRKARFPTFGEPGGLTAPVLLDDEALFYGIGVTLFQVHPRTGQILKRITLPGLCTSLSRKADTVEVGVQFSAPGKEPWQQRYAVRATDSDVPYFLTHRVSSTWLPRRDAEWVVTSLGIEPEGVVSAERTSPITFDERQRLLTAIDDLERLQNWDPTNPWYAFYRGTCLHRLGEDEKAAAAMEQVFDIDAAYDDELLPLTLPLDAFAPELGDRAFARAMTFLLSHGYDPDMTSTLLMVTLHLGSFGRLNLQTPEDLDRLTVLGERLWHFAPFAEWSAGMYQALADAHRDLGHADRAEIWAQRAREALPHRHFGFGSPWADATGNAINLIIACWIALILMLIVKFLRSLPFRTQGSSPWKWNPFAVWTRGEIIGFLIVQVLLVTSWFAAMRGITFISNTAGLPMASVSGNFGHPESLAYLSRFTGTADGRFVYALALHKAHRLDEAADIYQQLDLPRAKNNLGVIRDLQGRTEEAKTLFQEALNRDPNLAEAACNLGQPAESSRLARLQAYGAPGPIYAMPTRAQWARALTGPFRIVFLSDSFGVAYHLGQATPDTPVARARVSGSALATGILFVALTICALLGLFFRPQAVPVNPRPKRNLVGWALGFVVPGTARQLGVLGGPILVTFLFSLLVFLFLANSDGTATNILDAISTPHLAQIYGIWTFVLSPVEQFVVRLTHAWWVLWIINFFAVAALEVLFPDPWGPRKKG